MRKSLKWKSKLFSGKYEIEEEEKEVGTLKGDFLSTTSNGELFDTNVIFKSKGFIKQYIEIIKEGTDEVIGVVTFNNFMTKAKITINGTSYSWKYTNVWNTKWSVYVENEVNIEYTKKNTKGILESNINDALLILMVLP